jgi:hypothetical protein
MLRESGRLLLPVIHVHNDDDAPRARAVNRKPSHHRGGQSKQIIIAELRWYTPTRDGGSTSSSRRAPSRGGRGRGFPGMIKKPWSRESQVPELVPDQKCARAICVPHLPPAIVQDQTSATSSGRQAALPLHLRFFICTTVHAAPRVLQIKK